MSLSVRESRRAITALSEKREQQAADATKLTILDDQIAVARKKIIETGESDGYDAATTKADRERIDIAARMRTREDEIALLEQHLADREKDRLKEKYDQAVAARAGKVLLLTAAAQSFADKIKGLATEFDQYVTAQRAFMRDHPDILERPLASQVGTERAEQSLHDAFSVFSKAFARWPEWSTERKLVHVREAADKFLFAEMQAHEEMVKDWKTGAPKAEQNEEAAA